jgi:hypothetical protein
MTGVSSRTSRVFYVKFTFKQNVTAFDCLFATIEIVLGAFVNKVVDPAGELFLRPPGTTMFCRELARIEKLRLIILKLPRKLLSCRQIEGRR